MNKAEYVKSQGQTRKHGCHWPGCDKQVPPAKWGCSKHWFMLPVGARREVWRNYKIGQEKTLTPSKEYLATADKIEKWIKKNYNPDGTKKQVIPKGGGVMKILSSTQYVDLSKQKEKWYQLEVICQWDFSTKSVYWETLENGAIISYCLKEKTPKTEDTYKSVIINDLTDEMKMAIKSLTPQVKE